MQTAERNAYFHNHNARTHNARARTALKGIAVLIGALLLGSCSGLRSAPKDTEANAAPVDYRPKLISEMRLRLVDPTGIRDAGLSEPRLTDVGKDVTRYVACLRYNAKDENGAYSGIKERAVYFYGGQITQIMNETKDVCRGVTYEPWPALMQQCKEVVCPAR